MAPTFTSRLGIRKPDPVDLVSVATDINDGMDRIDAAMGFQIVTAFPVAPISGQSVAFSNDSYRSYFNNGTVPASGGWIETLNSSGVFGSNVKLASGSQLVIGADTNLYRSAANTLKTDDALIVTGLTTLTAGINGDLKIGGDLRLLNNTATFRPKLSSPTTVANTLTETYLASITIPANDAVVGAVYWIRAYGTFGVTGTPTLNIRNRFGPNATAPSNTSWGQTGAQTIQSGVVNRLWIADQTLICESTGASASWSGPLRVEMAGVVAGTAPFLDAEITTVIDGTTSVTLDSTVANTIGISATWSAASASNTMTCKGFFAMRIA